MHLIASHFSLPTRMTAITGAVPRDLATGSLFTDGVGTARRSRGGLGGRIVSEADWDIWKPI